MMNAGHEVIIRHASATTIRPDALSDALEYIQGEPVKIEGDTIYIEKQKAQLFELGAEDIGKVFVVEGKLIHIENPKVQNVGGKYICGTCGEVRNYIQTFPFYNLPQEFQCPAANCGGKQKLLEPKFLTITKVVVEDGEGRPFPAFTCRRLLVDANDLGEDYLFILVPRAKLNPKTGEGSLSFEIIEKIPKGLQNITEKDILELREEHTTYKDRWYEYVVQKFYDSVHIVPREDMDFINMKLILASLYSPDLVPILMVGDTGTGKTQIIQAIEEITGGLCMDNNITTAALIGSADIKETYSCIKAGALIKYNNSVVCIDEMEKCNDKNVYGSLLRYLSDNVVFKSVAGMTLNKKVNTKIYMNMNFLTGDFKNDTEVPLIDQIPLPKSVKTAFLRRCILLLFRDIDDEVVDEAVFDAMNSQYAGRSLDWFRKLWLYMKSIGDIRIPSSVREVSKEKALELRKLKQQGLSVKVSIKTTAEKIAKGIAAINLSNEVSEEHIVEAYSLLSDLLNTHKLIDGNVDAEWSKYENTKLQTNISSALYEKPKTILELHQELHQPKTTLQRKIKNIAIRIGTKRNNGKKPAAAYWTKKGIEYWLEDTFSPGTIFTSEDIVEKLGEVVLDEGAMNTILKQLHRDGVLDEVRDETYKLL